MKQASRKALSWLLTLAICLGMASTRGLDARANADEPELVSVNGVTFARVTSSDKLEEALANIGFCTQAEAYDWVDKNRDAVSAFLSQTNGKTAYCIFTYMLGGQLSGIDINNEGEVDDSVLTLNTSAMTNVMNVMDEGRVHVYCVTSKPDYELPTPDAYSFVRAQSGPLVRQLASACKFTSEEAYYLVHSPAFLDALNAVGRNEVVFVYALKDGSVYCIYCELDSENNAGHYTFKEPIPVDSDSELYDDPPLIFGVLRSKKLLAGVYYGFCTVFDGRVVSHVRHRDNCQSVTDSDTDVRWDSGWYVVDHNAEIDGTVVVNGDVHLILCDGAELTVNDGISAVDGARLSVYGGTMMGDSPSALPIIGGDGELSVVADEEGKAGISCDDFVIHGGTVYADGSTDGAGIGGSDGEDGGRFTIYGGYVNADGYGGGAGIGGGAGGNGGDITIYGGEVDSWGDEGGGAGIGGGAGGAGGSIAIYGGSVYGSPYYGNGAGIGGGAGGNGGNITIYGGTIDACTYSGAASIGGGLNSGSGKIAIYGGTTTTEACVEDGIAATGVSFGAGEGSTEPEDVTIGEGVTLYVYDKESDDYVPVEDPLTRVPNMMAKGDSPVLPETAVLSYFDSDSTGGTPPDAKSYSPGTTVKVSDNTGNLVKDGYVFSGWRAQPDCGKIYPVGDSLVVSENTDLYALWKACPPESLTAAQKPTGVTGLCAIGSLLSLVRDPVEIPEGYTMQYSLDGENWSKTVSARDEGEYTVRVRYVADENHIDFDGEDIIVTVGESRNPIVLRDASTGVELTIDNSSGSPMRRIFNDAAVLEGITETVDSATGHKTTVTTDVGVELMVVDKSGEKETALGADSDEGAPIQTEQVKAAYEIHLERVTRTTTAVTDEHGDPVGDPMTVVSAREMLSLGDSRVMVSIPYVKADYDTNLVYTVYHASEDSDGWKYENMSAIYNEEIGAFTFFTTHNSTYFIYSEAFTEADITTDFQVALRPTGTDGRAYDIVLSTESGVINRFTSAELTFQLTPGVGRLTYDVTANHADCVKVNDSTKDPHCFAFYVNGKEFGREMSDITARGITLGTVRFGGYGSDWGFEIKNAVIHTAKFYENVVVKTEGTASPTDADALVYTGANTTAAAPTAKINPLTISPDTRNLTVYVTFPNTVADHVSAYQDMTLTVSGGSLSRDIVVKLGGDALLNQESAAGGTTKNVAADIVPEDYPYAQGAAITSAYTAAGTHHYFTTEDTPLTADRYTVTLNQILALDTQYTVTVSGAGYRTVRYNVFMDEDKTLTFWNNVMDVATVVESGKDNSAAQVNYLAGDIVQDAQINVYDLSAAVSYFGSENAVDTASPNVRYDLNRDGKIDSIDVAYVLVSWGK